MSISFSRLTKAEYEALETKVANRIYFISDSGEQFLDGLPYDGEDNRDYFYMENRDASASHALQVVQTDLSKFVTRDFEWSTDRRTWTKVSFDGTTGIGAIATVPSGARVYVRGDNETVGNNLDTSGVRFESDGPFAVGGNIMSLMDKACLKTDLDDAKSTTGFQDFARVFKDSLNLVDASDLRLPATEIRASAAYNQLFRNCSALAKGPKVLPATEIPAPTNGMISYAYYRMFSGCSALSEAPDIRLEKLLDDSTRGRTMENMFRDATALSSVVAHFSGWVALNTNNWLQNTAATGVFKCPSALDTSVRDASHIPAGWTVTYTDVEAGKTIPSATSSDAGKVLTVGTTGTPSWEEAQGGGGDEDTLEALDDTITMLTSIVGELSDKNYFHVTALEPSSVSFRGYDYGNNNSNAFEYSYDRREWFKASLPLAVSLDTGEVLWLRNAGEPDGWDFVNTPILSGIGGVTVGGELLSLASKSVDRTKVFSNGGRRLYQLFDGWKALKGIEPGLNLSINGFDGSFEYAFRKTGLTEIPDNFAFPEGVTNASYLFGGCSSLTNVGDGFIIPNTVTNISNMFNNCSALASIGDGFTIPNSVTSVSNMLYRLNLTTIGNNVSINPGTNGEGNLDKNKITSIGTGFDYMSSYTTSASSGQAVFPNATIGNGWKIYQYSDL